MKLARRNRYICFCFCALFYCAFLFVLNSHAQTPEPAPVVRNLRDYLQNLTYDAAAQGPLLVIAPPEKYVLERPLSPPGSPTILLAPIAAAFGRQVFKAGQIALLAPRTMTLIAADLGKPNPLKDLSRDDALTLLFASLTPEQEGQLRGQGLTASALTREQRPLFQAFLPRMTARLARLTRTEDNKSDLLDSEEQATELDASQIRFRLVNRLQVLFQSANRPKEKFNVSDQYGVKRGESFWIKDFDSFDRDNDPKTRRAFGEDLFPVVPNHLKPSEIDYAASALDRPVVLSADLKTIHDLLYRVADAMHLELIADRRVDVLPIYLRATPRQSVRSGDILEALARSVSGAFRRMGPRTYLLTNDIEGIGTRRERQGEWLGASETARNKYRERAWQRIRERKQTPLTLDTSGTLALTPELRKKRDDYRPQSPGDRLSLPVKALPAEWRQELAFHAAAQEDSGPVDPERDTVEINAEPQLTFLAPDGKPIVEINGELRFSFIMDQLKMMTPENAPFPLPAPPDKPSAEAISLDRAWKRRILLFAPTTAENATEGVNEAQRRGFTEIWIRQPIGKTDAEGFAPLRAAIAAGKKAGVPIVAQTPLLRETGMIANDLTILGETPEQYVAHRIAEQVEPGEPAENLRWARYAYEKRGGWIALTDTVRAEVTRRVAQVASVPGLAGLAIYDASPPGYNTDLTYLNADIFEYEFGYLPEWRLAFLRKEGYDPVDLPRSHARPYSLPFFSEAALDDNTRLTRDNRLIPEPNGPSPLTRWRLFREKRSFTLIADVFQAAKTAHPGIPLYQSDRMSEVAQSSPFYCGLESPDKIAHPSYFVQNKQEFARAVSGIALLVRRIIGFPSAEPLIGLPEDGFFSLYASEKAKNNQGWDGLIVDMTEVPPARVLTLLKTLK